MSTVYRVLFATHPESKSKIVLAQSYTDRIPIDDCQRFHSLCKRVFVDLGCVTAITRATVTRFTVQNNTGQLNDILIFLFTNIPTVYFIYVYR